MPAPLTLLRELQAQITGQQMDNSLLYFIWLRKPVNRYENQVEIAYFHQHAMQLSLVLQLASQDCFITIWPR